MNTALSISTLASIFLACRGQNSQSGAKALRKQDAENMTAPTNSPVNTDEPKTKEGLEVTDTASSKDLFPWPASGVCAISEGKEHRSCDLSVDDGRRIQNAVASYLRSGAAKRAHSLSDLDMAIACVGPPQLLQDKDVTSPKIGQFFMYAGNTVKEIRLQNTLSLAENARWGFRLDLRQIKNEWVVTSFSRWQARRKRD